LARLAALRITQWPRQRSEPDSSGSGPFADLADISGLSRVIAAVFIRLELYDYVDTTAPTAR
jgi:hypothetical protein